MSDSRPVTPPPAPPRRTPIQFSMRTLLIAVTIVAILAALAQMLGGGILALLLLIVFLTVPPVCVATLAFYSRGYRQTFFLGALGGASLMFVLGCVWSDSAEVHDVLGFGVFEMVAIFSCGYAALATRRFLERRGWDLPSDRGDSNRSG